MPDALDRSRRLGDKEIGLVLKRAAELQHREPGAGGAGGGTVGGGEGSGLSLAELEQVAQEAGIDPEYVRRAVGELDGAALPGDYNVFLGAPTLIEQQHTLAGEVREAAFELLVEEIRTVMHDVGAVNTLGRSLTWHSTNFQRPVQITVAPRGGRTRIRVEEKLGNLAGGLFGGIMGGVGGGGMGAAMGIGIGALGSPVAAAVLATALLFGSYFLARGIFRSTVRRRSAELRRLVERLAEQVAEALGRSDATP